MNSYNEISEQLFSQLDDRAKLILETKKFAEIAVTEISSSLFLLRERVQKYGFKSESDEIKFFKTNKPKLVSNLSYYQFIYEIESNRPAYSEKKLKSLIKERKNLLFKEINRNPEFINYFRSGCSNMDHHYFIRGKVECKPCALKMHNLLDPGFSTSHDDLVSNIMTFDLLCENVNKLFLEVSTFQGDNSTLNFTDSKVAIIELAYALHFAGSINNGNSDIREICFHLSKFFNIEISDFYRSFLDIKARSGSKTRYLERLASKLNTAIYDVDGL